MANAQKSKTEVINRQQSIVLVKNMFRLSISSICFLRGIFPESCFSTKDYAGVKVHQLECAEKDRDGKLMVNEKDAFLLTQWLERGVFDALERSYLKSLTFAIYKRNGNGSKTDRKGRRDDEKDDVLLECYRFGIEYSEGVLSLNGVPVTRETLKQQAVTFIRCLVEFSHTLDALPDDRYLTMKMSYYDNNTPVDYQPEFFKQGDDIIRFVSKPVKVRVGAMKTPFLTMDLKFAGLDIMEESIGAQSQSDNFLKSAAIEVVSQQQEIEEPLPSQEKMFAVDMLGKKLSLSSINGTSDDKKFEDDSAYDTDTYNLVKSFVKKRKQVTIKVSAKMLQLDMATVKAVFNTFEREGTLLKRGTFYRVCDSISQVNKHESTSNCRNVTSIGENCPDGLQSWQESSKKSRDLLEDSASPESIVFTSSPTEGRSKKLKKSLSKNSSLKRTHTDTNNPRKATRGHQNDRSENDKGVRYGKLDIVTRPHSSLPVSPSNGDDDDKTVGFEENNHIGDKPDSIAVLKTPVNTTKRKLFYLSQEDDSAAKKIQKCSVIIEPIHQGKQKSQ